MAKSPNSMSFCHMLFQALKPNKAKIWEFMELEIKPNKTKHKPCLLLWPGGLRSVSSTFQDDFLSVLRSFMSPVEIFTYHSQMKARTLFKL